MFRRMTPKEVDAILPRLKVMARSSPRDKNMLVRRLNGNLPRNAAEWEKVRVFGDNNGGLADSLTHSLTD